MVPGSRLYKVVTAGETCALQSAAQEKGRMKESKRPVVLLFVGERI